MKSSKERLIEKLLSTGMNMTEISHLLTRFMEEEAIDFIDHIASEMKKYKPETYMQVHKQRESSTASPSKSTEKRSDMKTALNTKEACTYLGLNRKLLDTYRRCGLIKSIKAGRLYIYPISELNAFVDRHIGKEITKDGVVFG